MDKMTEREYRAYNALSYSFLKELKHVGPKVIVNGMDHKDSAGMTLGSLVDLMMTTPEYDFNNDFIISKYQLNLSGTTAMDNIIKYLYENPEYPIDEESMLNLTLTLDLWNKMGREAKLGRIFTEQFNEQYQLLQALRNGKLVISEEDYVIAMQMVETLKTHDFTREIFKPKDNAEILFQEAILFKIDGTDTKSLLDIIIVDHDNKKIYPKDLKTGAEYSFLGNFFRYEYALQAAMYTLAITSWKTDKYNDYEIMPFEFIYISRANPLIPFIYTMSKDFIQDNIDGYTNKYNEFNKGIVGLVDDYKWYIQNEIYDIKRDLWENKGRIMLVNNQKIDNE